MEKQRSLIWRIGLVGMLTAVLSFVMCARLVKLEMSAAGGGSEVGGVKTTAYTYTLPGARGGIYDRYGRPLVTNRVQSDLVIDYLLYKRSGYKSWEVAETLMALCRAFSQTWSDSFPVSESGAEYTDGGEHSDYLLSFIKKRKLAADLSAADLTAAVADYFSIPEAWELPRRRAAAGLLWEMEKKGFSNPTPFLLASDVSEELISAVAESGLGCVRVQNSCTRVYHTQYAAHLLGRTGRIYADEYETLKAQGYSLNDTVGKDGAEKAFESRLRGISGSVTGAYDPYGALTGILSQTEPVAGENIMLTIDIQLQQAVEDSLAAQIASMKAAALEDPKKPQDVGGAAVVVIKVDSGEVLAMASYPTYNITRFNELYNDMLEDPLTPMLNRALSGIYSPGSVFKMVTAVAGLETGVITRDTVITDTGRYTYYRDYQPTCWIYEYGITHGDETVTDAIRDSCNVFFYDVGRQLGIEKLSQYALSFGLGSYTGIELSGESKGYVASPEAKLKLNKAAWVHGDTLGAAIGQSCNLFTPLQICNYIATLANGGTRYNVHLMRYALSGDMSSVVSATEAIVENTVDMSRSTYQTVMEGMLEVTENGTASGVFKDYPIHVGGKTGSVEVSDGTANSVFCAFAPYDDPEIAVVIIVEHGGSGNSIAPVARDIFDAYFAADETFGELPGENTILW